LAKLEGLNSKRDENINPINGIKEVPDEIRKSGETFGAFLRIIDSLSKKEADRLVGDVDQVIRLLLAYQDTPISSFERKRRFLYNLMYLIASLIILAASAFLFTNGALLPASVFFLLGAAGFWMCGREGLGQKSSEFGVSQAKKAFSSLLRNANQEEKKEK
jgi:hypothetical protein